MTDDNPYAPPREVSEPVALHQPLTREQVQRRLAVPAYGILASVILNLAWLAWWLVMVIWSLLMVWMQLMAGNAVDWQVVVWGVVTVVVVTATNYAAVCGALAMLQLRDYRRALRGAWFAIVPCNVGCIVALPFAIYADWLLRNPEVHAQFAAGKVRLRPTRPNSLE